MKPTEKQATAYQHLFDFYNWDLFNGKLPPVILTFTFKPGTHGHFATRRWGNIDGVDSVNNVLHEISLNPHSLQRDPKEYISTLVHEMVHLWQEVKGTPGRAGYHNKEWARMMNYIGLKPISYDKPGKEIGQSVSHMIIEGGKYELAYSKMPKDYLLPYRSHTINMINLNPEGGEALPEEDEKEAVGNVVVNVSEIRKKQANKNGVRFCYACPECETKLWAKEGLNVVCGEDHMAYIMIG